MNPTVPAISILSPATVTYETTILKAIRRDIAPGTGANEFLANSEAVKNWIEAKKAISTRCCYYKIVMKHAINPAKELYVAQFNHYQTLLKAHAESQVASEREKIAMVDWPDIVDCCRQFMIEANESGDRWLIQDATIMACFVLIPPRRIDYSPMVVVSRKGKTIGNHLIARKHSMTFVFNEFKNVATIGQQVTEVPRDLEEQLRIWLALNPTNWLFLSKEGQAMSENTLSVTLTRLFQKRMKKKIGSSILRHCYVTWQRKDEMSLAKKRELANSMSHSVGMDELYRRV